MSEYIHLRQETIVGTFQLTNEEIQALLENTKKDNIEEALQEVVKEKISSLFQVNR